MFPAFEMKPPETLFAYGDIYITASAKEKLSDGDVTMAFVSHALGSWGDACPEDKAANNAALVNGGRLFSVFHDANGIKFWIITEADRSMTTILLPEDY